MCKNFLLLLFPIFSVSFGFSQTEFDKAINTKYLNNTLRLRYKDVLASGFIYKDSLERTFIITARHLFQKSRKDNTLNFKSGDSITFSYYDHKWIEVKAPIYLYSDTTDIAVIRSSNLIDQPLFNLTRGIYFIGQDCIFLGFPIYKMTNATALDKSYNPLALLNKGVISGYYSSDGVNQGLIYISASNTFGYSGGPVMCFNYPKNRWDVIGIVGGYYEQDDVIEYKDGSQAAYRENSGLMYATPIFFAERIINSLK